MPVSSMETNRLTFNLNSYTNNCVAVRNLNRCDALVMGGALQRRDYVDSRSFGACNSDCDGDIYLNLHSSMPMDTDADAWRIMQIIMHSWPVAGCRVAAATAGTTNPF